MNKAKLLEQLRGLRQGDNHNSYNVGIDEAIELVEQLTCITDPTFPDDIKEPVVLRDHGMLYLVKDGSSPWYYVTCQEKWLVRSVSDVVILIAWERHVKEYYPETRETK